MKAKIKTTKNKLDKLSIEFRKHLVTGISAAFGFLIALTWRDFIGEVVNFAVSHIDSVGNIFFYKFIIALCITGISILGLSLISKFAIKKEKL